MITFSYILLTIGLLSLYFSEQSSLLIIGIILLALTWTILKPITYALVGDVSTQSNVEFLAALFWMVQNIGVVSALLISGIFLTKIIYLISIIVIISSLMILLPLLRLNFEKIREKISQEVS